MSAIEEVMNIIEQEQLFKEMKKYMKIVRHGKNGTHQIIEEGQMIAIMEKLDGANASFRKDPETGKLRAFSRNQELSEHETLRGFYNWVQTIDPEKVLAGFIYYGEWLVPHTIPYQDDAWNKFYLFDVYSTFSDEYMPVEEVLDEAEELGLLTAPVFYRGEFQSWEHLMSFVGKSELAEKGEGIVIKNYDFKFRDGKQVFTKIVSPEFSEMAKFKVQQPKKDYVPTPEREFVGTFLTKARVEKIMHKLVDAGQLPEDYDITNMGQLIKLVSPVIHDDILEEEADELPVPFNIKEYKSSIGKVLPSKIKEVLLEGGRA